MMLGFLLMFLMMGLPVVLVVLLFAGGIGAFQYLEHSAPKQSILPYGANAGPLPEKPAGIFSRYCSHCGAGLQPDWTHCPQCGAPIQ